MVDAVLGRVSVTRSLGEGKRSKIRASHVGLASSLSGAEFGFDALGDFAHVCAALQLRLELAHQGAHGGHAFRIDTRERLVNEGVDFFSR